MRRWLLVLLILFTPLRGFAADWMAVSMALQQSGAAHHGQVARAAVAHAPAAAHPDCPGHVASASAPAGPGDDAGAGVADEHKTTCASCMTCSSAALAMESAVPAVAQLPYRLPQPAAAGFSSAAPLPGFKPPIS